MFAQHNQLKIEAHRNKRLMSIWNWKSTTAKNHAQIKSFCSQQSYVSHGQVSFFFTWYMFGWKLTCGLMFPRYKLVVDGSPTSWEPGAQSSKTAETEERRFPTAVWQDKIFSKQDEGIHGHYIKLKLPLDGRFLREEPSAKRSRKAV